MATVGKERSEVVRCDKLAIPVRVPGSDAVGHLILFAVTGNDSFEVDDCALMFSRGWCAREYKPEGIAPVEIHRKDGGNIIRLIENRTYEWFLDGLESGPELAVKSSLQDRNRNRWSVRNRKGRPESGTFSVVNHLGRAAFKLTCPDGRVVLDLVLEIISRKLNFDEEYRRMTEDIAVFCEQLLLSWNSPTALTFSSNPKERKRLLLEQYLFLSHYLTDERIGRVVEAIERFPHSELRREQEWKPPGMSRSSDFLSDPCRMLRDWRRGADGGRPVPGQVLDVRKVDSFDTEPNRFVKFALEAFRRLCLDVEQLTGSGTTIGEEARRMRMTMDGLLGRGFFRSLSRMTRLPLDNQTLQKREGYRELLRAWILTGAASSLNWEGNRDCYDGTTRDVATLYEYWIFIQMHRILKDIPHMEKCEGKGDPEDFVKESKGQLQIQLEAGKKTWSRFLWKGAGSVVLRIDLYYERTFTTTPDVRASGSYSRQFRPDYSLAIYPAEFEKEEEALKAGKVAHLHFDAKYRAESLAQVFGQAEVTGDDLQEEKREGKSLSTYKRGDLLKMHTYNDALRHTIGSYVLYPGDSGTPEKRPRFHEIAPGVGAYALKPGKPDYRDALKDFLKDVFEHQADRFSQFSYLREAGHDTLAADSMVKETSASYRVARKDSMCVLLWVRKESREIFRQSGFAYCHAEVRENLNLDLSIQVGTELIPCGGTGRITGLGWRAKIRSVRFIAKERLIEWLKQEKPEVDPGTHPKSSEHYLLFEFDDVSGLEKLDLDNVHQARRAKGESKYMAVRCKGSEILEQTSAEADSGVGVQLNLAP
jgi:predicted component of viral defense system (DUF524 family)